MSSVVIPRMAEYVYCQKCSGEASPGARAFMAHWLEVSAPVGRNLGIYNCRYVAGTKVRSQHACGTAFDAGVPVTNGGHGFAWEYLERLAPHARTLGVQAIIFARTVWADHRSPAGERYNGVHPHWDHMHIELTPVAGRKLNLTTVRSYLGVAPLGSKEEEVFLPLRLGDGIGAREFKRSDVAAMQSMINSIPGGPRLKEDGKYGAETARTIVDLTIADAGTSGRTFTGSMWGRLFRMVVDGRSQ